MARIRSVHPGQWTDEQFVSCSMTARLFAIALRNEADDQGVFPWKPLTLKMRLFPADDVDIAALLDALADADVIRRFELDGRVFGVVRNFARYQRPKKPTYTHPLPVELRTYVGLPQTRRSATDVEQVPPSLAAVANRSPNSSPEGEEKEGEKKRKEKGKGKAVSAGTRPGPDENSRKLEATIERWHVPLEWLACHTDRPRAGLRALLGRWCRDHGEGAVRAALDEAARSPPAEPVAWLEARLKRGCGSQTRDPLNEWLVHEDEARNQDPGI